MADPKHRTNLGAVLRAWRLWNELDLRQAGKRIGVSAPTWMRMERGHYPDLENFRRLLNWLCAPEEWREPDRRKR